MEMSVDEGSVLKVLVELLFLYPADLVRGGATRATAEAEAEEELAVVGRDTVAETARK